jgi:thioredoxin-dependent peroxiredoxin
MLAPGSRAPEFTLPDQDGRERSLTSLLSDGPLILYFYPADFTPGCTAEACSLRDLHTEIQHAGLRVVGVSPQSSESHQRFAQKYGLKYTLLADPDKTVIRMYDANGPLGIAVRRVTYLIDQNRIVIDSVLADFRISRHENFVRKAVEVRNAASS